MAKRKVVFDPEAAKKTAKKIKSQSCSVQSIVEAAEAFLSAISAADINTSISFSKTTYSELFLVGVMGFSGAYKLCLANKMVPVNYPGRLHVITTLINNDPNLNKVSIQQCRNFLQHAKHINVVEADILESFTLNSGQPVLFLMPPVSTCINALCKRYGDDDSLKTHHDPVTVTVYDLKGPRPAVKQALKCKSCSYVYNYEKYGNRQSEGDEYYEQQRELIEVSHLVYCDRQLHEMYCFLSLHCWVSFSGFAEAYFEYCHYNSLNFTQWHSKWNEGKMLPELSRKHVADMYYAGELEKEIRALPHRLKWSFKINDDREEHIKTILGEIQDKCYEHMPAIKCPERGCGSCYSIDGNWKLTFPHCMFPVRTGIPGLPTLNYPDVCTEQLAPGSAFCVSHTEVATSRGYPTKIKEFLAFCGIKHTGKADDEEITSNDIQAVDESQLKSTMQEIKDTSPSTSPAIFISQGTEKFIQSHPEIMSVSMEPDESKQDCRKDTGEMRKLRLWSRGHVFIVRSCGFIDMWKPIYRSESPSQVFLILISWLYETLSKIDKESWSQIIMAYDNMCHLDNLRAARMPLPLPGPYDKMWTQITKVIDPLHIKNHSNPACKEQYNPMKAKELIPTCNLMIAEQTFTWLSRYKKILNSMPKNHHLFTLHRLVIRRNQYTELCHQLSRKQLLPKAK